MGRRKLDAGHSISDVIELKVFAKPCKKPPDYFLR
jgi:hypothetical protein